LYYSKYISISISTSRKNKVLHTSSVVLRLRVSPYPCDRHPTNIDYAPCDRPIQHPMSLALNVRSMITAQQREPTTTAESPQRPPCLFPVPTDPPPRNRHPQNFSHFYHYNNYHSFKNHSFGLLPHICHMRKFYTSICHFCLVSTPRLPDMLALVSVGTRNVVIAPACSSLSLSDSWVPQRLSLPGGPYPSASS
jgi:hypothetical protein